MSRNANLGAEIIDKLVHARTLDFGRLQRQYRQLLQSKVPPEDRRWEDLVAKLDASIARVQARAASLPEINIDADLPIAAKTDEIAALLRESSIIIVAGETGSGKTTQLPKICLKAGLGVRGMIGCTQPRRIAARSVARRIAQEIGSEIGSLVGFQVRFSDQTGDASLVKLMTDGILLAEIQGDPWLAKYDALIIDEAHERSLNIDFLLGYLKNLSRRRPELKIIITSATIDTARFSAHFGHAPVVQVEGRAYPVETRFRDEAAPPFSDTASAIAEAVDDITLQDPLGDILVFLPGEREIRDAHQALEKRRYRSTEVLPLYARLAMRDQDHVFNPGVKRRIVLATNVAETSLTVPRIRFVVDPGLARVNRFSHRHKVQRLHIEKISRAAADQRKGRCGRVGPGICYRLYTEADYLARAEFTEPELLRSSLAGVILKLLSLKLGAIEDFPFIDRPSERAAADGYQQLLELDAITQARQINATGMILAEIPIDVKLAKILLAARQADALRELTVIAAFLSIQDPRERPADKQEQADQAHREFNDARSDFVAILNLWQAYKLTHEESSQSQLRAWCEASFLSFPRMREWRELHRQLLILCQDRQWTLNAEPADYERIHRALIAGFPTQVARKNPKGQYEGARGRMYSIFPGSGLAKSAPQWLLSAVLLDTQRLYGLINAKIEPEWVEQQAAHLIKRRHFDPHWSAAQGRVLAYEQTSLFGLVLVARRKVGFGRIDPIEARRIFIKEALLKNDLRCKAAFVAKNHAVLEQARAEEEKQRRSGLVKSEEVLLEWLDGRLPHDHLFTVVALDAWYSKLDAARKSELEWRLEDVLEKNAVSATAFPDMLDIGDLQIPLSYRFEPGHPADGATLELPLAFLNAIAPARLSWLVPGLLLEKATELIRSLPKALRRNFAPAPEFAKAFLDTEPDRTRHLTAALGQFLHKTTAISVPDNAWREDALPVHLRFNIRLRDENEVLAESRELERLQAEYGALAQTRFAQRVGARLAQEGLTDFPADGVPESITTDSGLVAYPALVDDQTAVAVRIFENHAISVAHHEQGMQRLLRLALSDEIKRFAKQLPLNPQAAIAYSAIGSTAALREDIVLGSLARAIGADGKSIRAKPDFDGLVAELRKNLFASCMQRLKWVEEALHAYRALAGKLQPALLGFAQANYDDLQKQLKALLYPGFAMDFAPHVLDSLPRYLRAMDIRIARLRQDPRKDQERMLDAQAFEEDYRGLLQLAQRRTDRDGQKALNGIEELRWLIEEYRVQRFAQEIKTKEPVSDKRLRQRIAEIRTLLYVRP